MNSPTRSKCIKLYTFGTPNGQKVSTFMHAASIDYELTMVDIIKGEQFSEDYVRLNPNSKIPVIVDPQGPEGKEHVVMESGAILYYLAKKYNKFFPSDPVAASEVMQWLFFQVGGIGPMFGQFGHFYKYAADQCDHPYPKERYAKEAVRLLKVLDSRLSTRDFLVDCGISIADFACVPWVICLDVFYEVKDYLKLEQFTHVNKWVERFLTVPGVLAGMDVGKDG
ncbi:MAG: glutathione binding-like protein [Bdellovibrionota bacterium]